MEDKRLIEDFLPIRDISAEASREKSVRKGHVSTLHLWWARRPLVACRAAVYAALVPAPKAKNGRGPKSDFVKRLCKYPGDPTVIKTAQEHILKAHKERGGEGRPKVLDMFAGGGSIAIEALRLGCESYALELNPVAHIIELCTLVYPQKYGKPGLNAKGSAKDGTWAGLAKEVEFWGNWVLERVKEEIGDLYPSIELKDNNASSELGKFGIVDDESKNNVLTPVAYLWTRTVKCKNPSCGAVVPLVRATWLRQKEGNYIALKLVPDAEVKKPNFLIVKSNAKTKNDAIKEFGFDPGKLSKGGNASCIFCGTVADTNYVKAEGKAGRIGRQLMAIVCITEGSSDKIYLSDKILESLTSEDDVIYERIEKLCNEITVTVPEEPIINDAKNALFLVLYGITRWSDVFTPRQLLALLTFTKWIRRAYEEMITKGYDEERAKVVATYLGITLSQMSHYNCTLSLWYYEHMVSAFIEGQSLPMRWDFAEVNPFWTNVGSWKYALNSVASAIEAAIISNTSGKAHVTRGTATQLPYPDSHFDAIVTDPPYYDNIPYADLSDFFYVWLKRSIGHLYPEHFSLELTPKKNEAVADATRHGGSKEKAKRAYEEMLYKALKEANRVLKPNSPIVLIYAHKTTAGWSTLVDALRKAGFTVVEAWPIQLERKARKRAHASAALASNIFMVARKRDENQSEIGDYIQVRKELEEIVRERVETLWSWGISGADLVIACVGAGLKAFTQYERVELPNGEEIPAEKFLSEVEGVVHETILEKLFGVGRKGVAAVDPPTRFYILWRYAYGKAVVDAGEAIVFAYPHGVELDGPRGLSTGKYALLEKIKSKCRLRDFTERGDNERLGLPEDGNPAPLIDVLHRILWLMENQTSKIPEFLEKANVSTEKLRLVAQALAGSALQGGNIKLTTDEEHSALQKLLTNWKTLIETNIFEISDTKVKQTKFTEFG